MAVNRITIRDKHGNVLFRNTFAGVDKVNVSVAPGTGVPEAESSYSNGELSIILKNIKGNGINNFQTFQESLLDGGTSTYRITDELGNHIDINVQNGHRGNGITDIQTTERQGDEAQNDITIKTTDNPDGYTFHVMNGSRGNGIASVTEEVSQDDGGVNTHTITDTDGNQHFIHTKNGRTGPQGDSAIWNANAEKLTNLSHVEGNSSVKPMSQKGITKALKQRGQYVEGEYLYIMTDADNRLVFAIEESGNVVFGAGVPEQVQDYVYEASRDLSNFIGNLKEEGTLQSLLDEKANAEDVGKNIENNEYLYVIVDKENKVVLAIRKDGALESPTITAINNRIDNIEQKHVLNVANSDKIAVVGASYTQSDYAVKGKSFVSKLSLFSDYIFNNFGQSGSTNADRMYDIRNGSTTNGTIKLDEQGNKYAMITCYANDVKYLSVEQYITSTRQMCSFLQGIGIMPIICTVWHTNFTSAMNTIVRSSLRKVAEELNVPYYDIASIVDLLLPANRLTKEYPRYSPFWGGSHPGTRVNAMESDNYEKYLAALPRPMKSLKLFRARTDEYYDSETLDEYMFHQTEQRAGLFKEIHVGAIDLSSAAKVDTCNNANTTTNKSEYHKIQNKQAVSFGKVSLISAVLSTRKNDLKSLDLAITHTANDLHVYVKDTLVEPFPIITTYSSFRVPQDAQVAVGDEYSYGGDTYTVVAVAEDGIVDKSLICSPYKSGIVENGTLTKVSGDGDSSISFSLRERGMNPADVTTDTTGHWQEVLQEEDGTYDLFAMPNCIDVDRVDILLVSDTSYSISDVQLSYVGDEKDTHQGKEFVFDTNYYNTNPEMLPASTFGTIGEPDVNWGGVTPSDTYEGVSASHKNIFPVGCSSKVDVDDNNYLEQDIVVSEYTSAVLEVWCRYFPDIYTDGSGNQITENSYDYSDCIVTIVNKDNVNRQVATMRERVNTYWKIVRFPMELYPNNQSGEPAHTIRISSNKSLEVCYVSLKKK